MAESAQAPSSRADLWKIWIPVGLVVVAGFVLAFTRLEPPPPTQVRMAAGSPGGAYHAFAERYRKAMASEGYELEVVETAGSGENLELLARGEVDLALVQGGTASTAGTEGLESWASLFFEPVWIFFTKELGLARLADLEGRRVAVGAKGSGTRTLALALLAASGLGPENCELLELPPAEATAALDSGAADAAFFVTSIEAPYLASLFGDESLDLLAFRRHRAYSRFFPYLSRVVLGEGVYDLERNLPRQDVSLLAAAAGLVARAELHEGLIPLVLEASRQVHGSGGVFHPPGTFPSTRYLELPMNPQARIYLERGPSFLHRFLPFRVAMMIDRTKILLLPLITLLIPLFRVAPPLYRWRIRSRIYRWYEDLRGVDEVLHGDPEPEELRRHIDLLRRLEKEVFEEVSVPLSYMDEYYRLRGHIELVLKKLESLGQKLSPKP